MNIICIGKIVVDMVWFRVDWGNFVGIGVWCVIVGVLVCIGYDIVEGFFCFIIGDQGEWDNCFYLVKLSFSLVVILVIGKCDLVVFLMNENLCFDQLDIVQVYVVIVEVG